MSTEYPDLEVIDGAFSILKHPIRRTILKALWKKDCSFLELIEICEKDHGKLVHHLRKMGSIVKRDSGSARAKDLNSDKPYIPSTTL